MYRARRGPTRQPTPGWTSDETPWRTIKLMTSTDYIIDIGLVALVLLQVRGRRLSAFTLLMPLVVVAWAISTYLKTIPTAGNDLVLIGVATAAGLVLGALCGVFTSVWRDSSGQLMAKAGLLAALFWVLGVGTRLAFQLYATNGGGLSIEHFMVAHDITNVQAWTAALILMALAEVLARSALIWGRAYALGKAAPAPVATAQGRMDLVRPAPSPVGDHDGWR